MKSHEDIERIIDGWMKYIHAKDAPQALDFSAEYCEPVMLASEDCPTTVAILVGIYGRDRSERNIIQTASGIISSLCEASSDESIYGEIMKHPDSVGRRELLKILELAPLA